MKRINYLQLIHDMFYSPGSEIYKVAQTFTQFKMDDFVMVVRVIHRMLDSDGIDPRPHVAMEKVKTNVKNALQRACGKKLARSGRLHGSGLIQGEYTYNDKHFTVQYHMNGTGRNRSTWILVRGDE